MLVSRVRLRGIEQCFFLIYIVGLSFSLLLKTFELPQKTPREASKMSNIFLDALPSYSQELSIGRGIVMIGIPCLVLTLKNKTLPFSKTIF